MIATLVVQFRRMAGASLLLLAAMPVWGTTVVYYPRPESQIDKRTSYPVALLQASLDKSGADYRLEASPARMQQGRSLRFLEQGKHIDIVWTVTSRERERKFLPVRIPIDRGLIGMRLLLVHSSKLAAFGSVGTREDLAAFRAGQGHDWPDTAVLRANGLPIATSSDYEALFKMLALGHIDYFPRAVGEIWPELEARPGRGLAVAPGLLLYYPQALYYFVRLDNQPLADAVARGLRAAIADGTMARLFQQYYGAALARAELPTRKAIVLPNPELPASAPVAETALWIAAPVAAQGR